MIGEATDRQVCVPVTEQSQPAAARRAAVSLAQEAGTDEPTIGNVALVVTELAVIGFPDGRATLLETMDGVTVEEVVAATEAELAIPPELSGTGRGTTTPESISEVSMGEVI